MTIDTKMENHKIIKKKKKKKINILNERKWKNKNMLEKVINMKYMMKREMLKKNENIIISEERKKMR